MSEDFRRRFQQAADQAVRGKVAALVLTCPEHRRNLAEDADEPGLMRCPADGCRLAVKAVIVMEDVRDDRSR